MDDQEQLIEAQVLLTQNQADKVNKEIEVLEVEKNKTTAEVSLVNAQTSQSDKQTEVLTAQLLNIPKEGQLIDKQVLKAQSETDFLEQRIFTEQAQIKDVVDGASVVGVIGKQKELYQAQADGFVRDAEQKAAKLLVDTWSVRRSTDDGTVADNVNKLSDANIGAVVSKVMTSIDVTPV
jgi:DNA integrity scanning protein DisA with diadenylate cyclase activity